MLLLSSPIHSIWYLICLTLLPSSTAYPGARKRAAFPHVIDFDASQQPPSRRAAGLEAGCRTKVTYNVTAQHGPFDGTPALVAGEQCASHAAGCSIASGKMYGVTVTTSVGADLFLTIPDILQAGVTTSVSLGTTTTDAVTTTVVCPNNCICGIQAVPQLYHVEGFQNTTQTPVGNGPCKKTVTAPYAMDLPVLDPGASQDNQAVVLFSACRVSNSTCFSDKTLPACPATTLTH